MEKLVLEELNSANELTAAVNVWTAGPRTDGGDQEQLANSSPRERVDEFWTGPECGFLNAVRLALADHFPPSLVREPDRQAKQSPLSDLLDQLCEEFTPEVQAAECLFSESHGFEPHGVFQSKAWQQRLQDHTQQDRTSLSADQSERRNALGQKLFGNDFRTQHDSRMLRFAMLAAAIAHASRAAWTLRTSWDANDQNLPNGFAADTVASMRCVCGVWPLLTGSLPVEDLKIAMPEPAHEHTATIAMRRLLVPDQADIRGIPTSAWLTVLHLLRWLLTEESETADTPAKVLLQTIDGLTNQGRSISLNLQTSQESQTGCFIDLVNTGLVLPDADMLQSLNIAWEISSGTLRNRCVEERRVLALQLHFDVRSEDQKRRADVSCCDVRELVGDSAGGMAGLAMYAVADGKTPDVRVTGSFAIRRQHPDQRITLLNDIIVSAVASATLIDKVVGAADARCGYFLLAEDQHREDLERVAGQNGIQLVPLPPSGFDQGRQQLTTNAKLAEILEPLNQAIVKAWESIPGGDVKGTAAGSGKAVWLRKPQPYIEPHLGQLKLDRQMTESSEESVKARQKSGDVNRMTTFDWLTDDESVRNSITDDTQDAVAEAEYLEMFHRADHTHRICIAEDANAGKTVLSKRLAAFAAGSTAKRELFAGEPPLILRWENGPIGDSQPWPSDLKDSDELLNLMAAQLHRHAGATLGSQELARELARQGRVVLILDSLDQSAENIPNLLQLLASDSMFADIWVVVTGRAFSFSQSPLNQIFTADRWSQFTILGFTKNQQERYLRTPAVRQDFTSGEVRTEVGPLMTDQPLKDFFTDCESIQELLGVAGMLAMVRSIGVLEQQEQTVARNQPYPAERIQIRMERLKSRCDFYMEFFSRQMLAAAEKNPKLNVDDNMDRWQLMLSATAFRMVLQRATNYTVQGDVRTDVRNDVVRFCEALRVIDVGYEITDEDWGRLREFSSLSDHSFLEGASTRVLSFRHKGWMEFFAGWFLARYLDEDALAAMDFDNIRPFVEESEKRWPGFQGLNLSNYTKRKKPDFRGELKKKSAARLFDDVLLQLTNDPQWYWMWRFAAEMPRYQPKGQKPAGPVHGRRLLRSLSCLLLQPAREIRPNELAWRAFYLFEQDERTEDDLRPFKADETLKDVREAAVSRFRDSSRDLVEVMESHQQQWDNVPLKGSAEFDEWMARWRSQSSRTKSHTFLQCPPEKWLEEDPDANVHVINHFKPYNFEEPRHRVRVKPFQLLATPVTQRVYGTFDSAFLQSHVASEIIKRYGSPPPHAHGDEGDFTDYPIIMTDWFDSWTFCKWLGPDFCLPSQCQHISGLQGGQSADYYYGDNSEERLLSEEARINENPPDQARAVGLLRPNHYGLFDVDGLVTEWSHDWHTAKFFSERNREFYRAPDGVIHEDWGAAYGSTRLQVGASFAGHWDSSRVWPARREESVGFRVVRSS